MADVTADDSWLEVGSAVTAGADDWLNIEDPNAGRTTAAFQGMVNACMRGTNRVMATDGRYLAYRPYNREFDKQTNPRTIERMNDFREKGFYKHLGTFDEVEIYELMPGNPYYHEGNKAYVVGQNYFKDIRQAARLACERKWAEYHDFMGGMAQAIKTGRDPIFARTMWDDAVNHVAVAISQMGPGAPTEKEVNEGFIGIRRARGITGKNGTVVTLNSNALQKVGFDKR